MQSQQTTIRTSQRLWLFFPHRNESTLLQRFSHAPERELHWNTTSLKAIMAATHGTRRRYNDGCYCEDCTSASTAYQQRYRQRPTVVVSLPASVTPQPIEPGPVESGVKAEISGSATDARPGLAATALALARIMDNPRAVSPQPTAARQLAVILGTLSKPTQPRGKLAVVKSMTSQRAARR